MGNDAFEFTYEEKANEHTLKGFLYIAITAFVMWMLAMLDIFNINKQMMTIGCLSAIALTGIPYTLRGSIRLTNTRIKYYLLADVCMTVAVIVGFLSMHVYLLYVLPILFTIQYRNKRVLWVTYVMNGVTMLIGCCVSFYYGLCDLNILLESNYTRSYYMEQVLYDSITLPLNSNINLVIVLFEFVPNMIMLFVFCYFLQYTVLESNKEFSQIKILSETSNTDSFTGLYNKRKYEDMIGNTYNQLKRVGVIFWDLNMLKKTNDELGHDMGDILIKGIAECIKRESNDRRKAYRIGGDEFVMIIDDPYLGEPDEIIAAVRNNVHEINEINPVKISTAVGWSIGEGREIKKVIKTADANMYSNKKSQKKERIE